MKIQFNLLPKKQRKHLQIQKMFRIITEQEIQILIICLVLFVSIFGMYFVLRSETAITNEIKEAIINQESYKKIIEIHKTFKKVRGEVSIFSKLTTEHVHWSQLLIMLSESIPNTITINTLTTKDNTITMQAIANTREDVVELKEILRNVKYKDVNCFEKIVVPESELTVPIDVNFKITLDVNVVCLR
jgi:Tfp pilus assembly protein PilN